MMFGKKIIISLALVLLIVGGFFYFRYEVYYSHGSFAGKKVFEVGKGEGNAQVSERLKDEGLVSGRICFYYYMKSHALMNKILPGKYELSGKMTIQEIAQTLTQKKEEFVKITFPEGWTSAKMAKRLTENNLPGDDFLKLVNNPDTFRDKYEFLKDPKTKSLEGFLFPDTYFFTPQSTAENIISKMLDNFSERIDEKMKGDMEKQKKNLKEILTMASVVEMEVKSDEDRSVVSGIFWNRVNSGRALQSCATIAYILGVSKKQYTFEDTRIASPYNTYLNPDLPPGPIGNPGLSAIRAAIYPRSTEYMYFLSDPETGKTYFAKTIDEHNANKVKFGL